LSSRNASADIPDGGRSTKTIGTPRSCTSTNDACEVSVEVRMMPRTRRSASSSMSTTSASGSSSELAIVSCSPSARTSCSTPFAMTE
jgi:hypothetical protein